MTAIDKAALIEQAAKAAHDSRCGFHRADGGVLMGHYGIEMSVSADVSAALPVIAAGLLEPLRELHKPVTTREMLPNGVSIPWQACSCGFRTRSACPTLTLIDAILAEVTE